MINDSLMTPLEMEERLLEGEDAFDLAIEKWIRIKKYLENGNVVRFNDYSADTCALCYIHTGFCFGKRECGILPCPLTPLIYCHDINDPWHIFRAKQTPENAQVMIDTLESVRDCK